MSKLKQTTIDSCFRQTKNEKRIMYRKSMLKLTKNNTITDVIDLTSEDYTKLSPSKITKLNLESSVSQNSAVNGNVPNCKKVSSETIDNNLNSIQIKVETNEISNKNCALSPPKRSIHNHESQPETERNEIKLSSRFRSLIKLKTGTNDDTNGNIELSPSKKFKLNHESNGSELNGLEAHKNVRVTLSKKFKENNLNTADNVSKKRKSEKKVNLDIKTNEHPKTTEEIKTELIYEMKYDIRLILSSESESEKDDALRLENRKLVKTSSSRESKKSTSLKNKKQKNTKSSKEVRSKNRKKVNVSLCGESSKSINAPCLENKTPTNTLLIGESSFSQSTSSADLKSRKRENTSLIGESSNQEVSITKEFLKSASSSDLGSRNQVNTSSVGESSNQEVSITKELIKSSSSADLESRKQLVNNAFSVEPSKSDISLGVESTSLEDRKQGNVSVSGESENSTSLENSKQRNTLPKSESFNSESSASFSTNASPSKSKNFELTSLNTECSTSHHSMISVRNDIFIETSRNENFIETSRNDIGKKDENSLNNTKYDIFICHFDYMLDYIFKHEQFKLLLNENQMKMLDKLKTYSFQERKLCIRLYYRKFIWYRTENLLCDKKLSFNLNSTDMSIMVQKLSANSFLDTNISVENLANLLELLSAPELKIFMKLYKIKAECKKREGMIQRIIKNTKNQKLMFGNPVEKLKKKVCQVLGSCVKLTDAFIGCLQRIHLLFGITEQKTPQEMHRCLIEYLQKTIENRLPFQIEYPKLFKLFEDEKEFSEYEENRLQYEKLLSVMESKDNTTAMIIILRAFKKYETCIHSDIFLRDIKLKPSFLRKFSSSNYIIRILSDGITVLKQEIKKTSSSDDDTNKMTDKQLIDDLLQEIFHTDRLKSTHICQILDALLAQDILRTHKKSEWLKEKILILKNLDINSAVKDFIDLSKIEKYKNCELTQIYFKDEIESFLKSKKVNDEHKKELQKIKLKIPPDIFPSITVPAVEVANNQPGRKKMYKSQDDNGQNYSSVEEVAINYYTKCLNFEDGIHCEGSLLSTLFDLLFWDIIYECYVPNTFISPMQTRPLDMYSRCFYTNRKDVIDVRLNDIQKWSNDEFEMKLQEMLVKVKNYVTLSKVANVLMAFVKSIQRDVLVKILRKLIEEHGTYRAGFPDIVLWNTRLKKCKFVEVKGQHDKLRPKQKLWLRFLLSIEADAELCHVHTMGYSK